MTYAIADIPLADQEPDGDVETTRALSKFKAATSRRNVLRGLTFSALAVGTLALSWGSPATRRAIAESGPSGLTGWDRNDCADAYPSGYSEQTDSQGSAYRDTYGACFGGNYISSEYCAQGWHRSDTVGNRRHTPRSDVCGPRSNAKNAWKWTTPDGKVYRCSDGNTTVNSWPFSQTYFTICRALV